MTGIPRPLEIEKVPEADVSRRSFLRIGSGCLAASYTLSANVGAEAGEPLQVRQTKRFAAHSNQIAQQWGLALAYGENRLDLIDLDAAEILQSFDGLRATHAQSLQLST